MAVDRMLPSQEAEDLIALTRDIADKVLDPVVDAHEKAETYLPGMLSGEQIGAYSLSEPQAGSDAAALQCKAVFSDEGPTPGYVLNGSKSWITHGGRADFYTLFARTRSGSGGDVAVT